MNAKPIDHRGHREHGGESNGTLAQGPFFPHQTRPAKIIRVLKRNLIATEKCDNQQTRDETRRDKIQ